MSFETYEPACTMLSISEVYPVQRGSAVDRRMFGLLLLHWSILLSIDLALRTERVLIIATADTFTLSSWHNRGLTRFTRSRGASRYDGIELITEECERWSTTIAASQAKRELFIRANRDYQAVLSMWSGGYS